MIKINKRVLDNATVLYVEDEKSIRDEIESLLGRYLKKLYVASNGEEGLKLYKEKKPDLVITDIQMPVMNGLEMIKAIGVRNVPVIITTAYSDMDYFLEAIELKVDKFIIKPINVIEILENIQNLVSSAKLKQRLIENDKLLEIIDENVLISITDTNGVIVDASSAFCDFVGYKKDELLGNTHKMLKHEDNKNSFYENMWNTIKDGKVFKSEIKNRKKSHEVCWANLTITPLVHEDKIENFIAIRQDITNKKKLEKLTIHDDMTGLYNRRYLNSIVDKEVRRIKRENSTLSLVTIDVDNFKKYNDTYGHPSGDIVLIEVARVLRKCAKRATDYIFRMGGEEFGMIFSDLSIKESLDFVNEVVHEVANLKIEHKNSDCSGFVTISAGLVVQSAEHLDSFKTMYKYSDEALYEAKKNGKNQTVLSDESL